MHAFTTFRWKVHLKVYSTRGMPKVRSDLAIVYVPQKGHHKYICVKFHFDFKC